MGIETDQDSPLADAVRRAGGQSAFARLIGRSQSTVFDWLRFEKSLPPEHILKVERATGVSRHLLDPVIYPPVVTAGPLSSDAAIIDAGVRSSDFDRVAEMKRGGEA
ncbi:YdaS family helix-turn-helix protein [Sphingomonas sp. LB2R24]|uniref:transcriptional regulator n=1 Tax=Sphingomonas sorbitolis TaxID=3096165 RepID=UPI002FC8D5DE